MVVTTAHPRHVWVNHGRYITRCPCDAYLEITSDNPHQCRECQQLITPVYPPNTERNEAWRLLRQRPVPNQNWTPTLEAAALNGTLQVETIEQLAEENKEHL